MVVKSAIELDIKWVEWKEQAWVGCLAEMKAASLESELVL